MFLERQQRGDQLLILNAEIAKRLSFLVVGQPGIAGNRFEVLHGKELAARTHKPVWEVGHAATAASQANATYDDG